MFKLKKTVSAMMAAIICISGASSVTASTLTANAASAGTTDTITITESDINTEVKQLVYGEKSDFNFKAASGSVGVANSGNYLVKNGNKFLIETDYQGLTIARKYRATFQFTVNQKLKNKADAAINKGDFVKGILNFNVEYQESNDNPAVCGLSNFNLSSPQKYGTNFYLYTCSVDFISYSDKAKFKISAKNSYIDNKDNITINSDFKVNKKINIKTVDSGAYYAKVVVKKNPKLEVYSFFPGYRDITTLSNYTSWVKNITYLAVSLKDITNSPKYRIIISVDDPQASCTNAVHSCFTATGVVCVKDVEGAKVIEECEDALSERNLLNWGIMHELSHCFSEIKSDDRDNYYDFDMDDIHTNIRSMVAMQNCYNLKDTVSVLFSDLYCGRGVNVWKKLYKRAKDINDNDSCVFFPMKAYYSYIDAANAQGWAKLESFYRHGKHVNYLTKEIIDVACEFSVIKSDDAYRFINSMYYLCTIYPGYGVGAANFRKFINKFFTANDFKAYMDRVNTHGHIYAKRTNGDVNNDGKVNSSDMTILNNYFAKSNYKLDYHTLIRADINGDGRITPADRSALESLIK